MTKFKCAAVFSDDCVLQRDKETAIFGEASRGSEVEASLSCAEENIFVTGRAVSDGRFLVKLPPVKACTNCVLTVKCDGEVIEFKNVAVGEVWLCGGQSNMEYELQNIKTAKEHLENDKPDVRFYYTQKRGCIDEEFLEEEAKTHWTLFGPETAKNWSAVGYLAGKKLSEKLGVTVGLIGCNWGGTSASAWIDNATIAADSDTDTYITDYEAGIAGKSEEQQIKEYKEYQAYEKKWNEDCAVAYAENPTLGWEELQEKIGKCLWPGPINCINPYRPAGLYETMLKRVMPYTLKGFLYYQGESDEHKPGTYYKLFTALIKKWRVDWGEELPFICVQLPGFIYADREDDKSWCVIRQAQDDAHKSLKDVGMACIIDCGEFNEIHPSDKEAVGERVYRQMLYVAYKMMDKSEAEAPGVLEIKADGDGVTVRFDCEELELKGKSERGIGGFRLAGDGEFYDAYASLINKNTVRVTCPEVKKPEKISYLWDNYPPEINLYSKSALPVKPFTGAVKRG